MAAYAALVSVMHIIDQIQNHPHPPISLDKLQVQSLAEKVTFLQEFLESYSNRGSEDEDALERRITDAAYSAEDIIESHIVDKILGESTSHGKKISFFNFFRYLCKTTTHIKERVISDKFRRSLQKVIDEMELIKEEVMDSKKKNEIQNQLHCNPIPAGSLRSLSTGRKNMVGFDDILTEVLDKLTGQQCNRLIIPIVGMGGIGKTTLAKNVYVNPLIKHHFDFCGWATISQDYSAKEILKEVLVCLKTVGSRESLSQMREDQLGEKLYQSLWGRRYLIILDDIWDIEAWNKVKFFFPDNNNGSRIILTTRLSNLAFQLSGSHVLKMNLLDEDSSWILLCKYVFGEEGCPVELEEIGKVIVKNCNGLPLSITVIGGVLAKTKQVRGHWQYIAENLNSIVNLEDNERCLRILRLSYEQLPVHLKPCFLYMGIFPEDRKIRVSDLMKLWVAEGFLKPISGKILEVVAKEYFNDLIDRNLVLVDKLGYSGNIKVCTIHDLLRDLCIMEAEKGKFLRVVQIHSSNIPQDIHTQRRIGIHQSTSRDEYFPQVLDAVQSASLSRSLICDFRGVFPLRPLRLLRVLKTFDKFEYFKGRRWRTYSIKNIFHLVNSRHLAIVARLPVSRIPSSVYRFWNLQTLVIVYNQQQGFVIARFDIWKMPQLRHVRFRFIHLPDPPSVDITNGGDDVVVLENLQSLQTVSNFKCSEEVVKRIPNIKKLKIYYDYNKDLSPNYLNNLCQLHKLESLAFSFHVMYSPSRSQLLQNLTFPISLKKLTLGGTRLNWEDMRTKIGLLPHLQILKLRLLSFSGPEWETIEGQFNSLKFLLIRECNNLEHWRTESTHFPCLEHIVLQHLRKLKEIPWGIGEIPTLKSIELEDCTHSAIISAKKILEEQEELGNKDLQIRVRPWEKNKELESLASCNFQVKIW